MLLFQDDQDEVNQNYLADEEEEAEEEASVMVVSNLEDEKDEEEEKEEEEEEEKEEEEGQSQPTGNAWWQKLQVLNEYLWDPERRTSLARTGQSWSKSQSSQCPSLVSFAFAVASRDPLPQMDGLVSNLFLAFHVKALKLRKMSGPWTDCIRTNCKAMNKLGLCN